MLAQAALVPPALATGVPTGVAGDSPSTGLLDNDRGFDQRGRGLRYPDAAVTAGPPRFVHQKTNNCAFASAAMLIDKWTGGAVRPSQSQLRAASGVPVTDGVGFSQLARAVAAVTRIDMRFSPRGRDALTWDELLARLAKGAGAVIAGDYSDFPRHYQRWAPGFAALGPKLSGHAVYIERFQPDRQGGRVWLMDPLGRGRHFAGEWIAVKDLRAFAWRYAGGFVAAAATPEPQPFSGYRIRDPQLGEGERLLADQTVSVRLPIRIREGWRTPNDLSLATVWQPILLDPPAEVMQLGWDGSVVDPGLANPLDATDAESSSVAGAAMKWDEDFLAEQRMARSITVEGALDGADETSSGMIDEVEPEESVDADTETLIDGSSESLLPLAVEGKWLKGELRAPAAPGLYRVTFELRDADGAGFPEGLAPEFQPIEARVIGALAGDLGEPAFDEELHMGSTQTVTISVANIGSGDWAEEGAVQLVATWETEVGPVAGGAVPVELGAGEEGSVAIDVLIPTHATNGTLVLDLVSVGGVSFSAVGLEPTRVDLEFAWPTRVTRGDLGGPLNTN